MPQRAMRHAAARTSATLMSSHRRAVPKRARSQVEAGPWQSGAPCRIRTSDHRIRSPVLYPAELMAHEDARIASRRARKIIAQEPGRNYLEASSQRRRLQKFQTMTMAVAPTLTSR